MKFISTFCVPKSMLQVMQLTNNNNIPTTYPTNCVLLLTIVVVQLLSFVQLLVTPGTAACQASLSFTISLSLFKLMSIESVIPSNHLTLCCPLFLNCSQHRGPFQRIGSLQQQLQRDTLAIIIFAPKHHAYHLDKMQQEI